MEKKEIDLQINFTGTFFFLYKVSKNVAKTKMTNFRERQRCFFPLKKKTHFYRTLDKRIFSTPSTPLVFDLILTGQLKG